MLTAILSFSFSVKETLEAFSEAKVMLSVSVARANASVFWMKSDSVETVNVSVYQIANVYVYLNAIDLVAAWRAIAFSVLV